MAVHHRDEVEFDGVAIDRYGDGWTAPDMIDGEARTDGGFPV